MKRKKKDENGFQEKKNCCQEKEEMKNEKKKKKKTKMKTTVMWMERQTLVCSVSFLIPKAKSEKVFQKGFHLGGSNVAI